MRLLNGSDRVPLDTGRVFRVLIGDQSLQLEAVDVVDAVRDAQQQVPAEIRSVLDITRPRRPR